MDTSVCFLLTMLVEGCYLTVVALKVAGSQISRSAAEFPMEPESRKELFALLPEQCRVGPIVHVDHLFEVIDTMSHGEAA